MTEEQSPPRGDGSPRPDRDAHTDAGPGAHTDARAEPSTTAEGVATDGAEHERRRRRVALRILGVGGALSLLVSLLTGVLGLPGRVGGALFLSLLSLTTGVAGATVAVWIVVDQYRGVRIAIGRVLLTGGLLLLTLLLLVAAAGATLDAARAGP